MKFFIAPIVIIVGLIIFFIVVDCREFKRDNTIQSVQTDSKAFDNSYLVDFQHVGQTGGGDS